MENDEINWTKYAKSYDYMCSLMPEYKELIEDSLTHLKKLPFQNLNLNVLELGSGTGNVLIEMIKKFPNSTFSSLELNESFLKIQKDKLASLNLETKIRYIQGDVTNLTNYFQNEKFDIVAMYHILNFLDKNQRDKILKNVYNLLSPNGYITISDIGRDIPVKTWLDDTIRNLNLMGEDIENCKLKLEPAINANYIALNRQKNGQSFMHNLIEFKSYIQSFGFEVIYSTDKYYRGIDDFIIGKKSI